jgi:hydrogenase maturation protein HypF
VTAVGGAAVAAAASAIAAGRIVAVKGLGGFHHLVDARDDGAGRRLRERKHRDAKPFAGKVPTDAEAARLGEVPTRLDSMGRSSPRALVWFAKLRIISSDR